MNDKNWTKPQAIAIPKEGYFTLEKGRYGPIYPRTPACYGFTIIAKIKPGTEEEIRNYGKRLERALSINVGPMSNSGQDRIVVRSGSNGPANHTRYSRPGQGRSDPQTALG